MRIDTPNLKKQPLSAILWFVFNALASATSIIAFIQFEKFIPEGPKGYVYACGLVLITSLSIGYAIFLQRKKLHRYADIAIYFHFVNHTVRDTLTWVRNRIRNNQFSEDDFEEIDLATNSIVDAIAGCFSVLTGTQCGVCIKEFADGLSLRVALRDSLSKMTRGKPDPQRQPHPITEDTPCNNVFFGADSCLRSFCSNDVVSLWRINKYSSPSFEIYGGPPETFTLFGHRFVKGWKLHYKSTLASPIRFMRNRMNTSKLTISENPANSEFHYWGFLCVDAKKRHVFDIHRHPDVIAAFSDCLYIYFSELYDSLEDYKAAKKS
ncbi:hypothetical protein [Brevifollis gellanilyticus]|uniref:hypothetical protein n=1 Tax=Brevifollis gellanilyticus TaxID=748831 RepID=UPI0011BFD462|nr:hypothetical protein [Brevifollis gellanilyticus]